MMRISDYDYPLPDTAIAYHPPKERGTSRLLVLARSTGKPQHRQYTDMSDYLAPGDVVVLNNTKVIRARLVALNDRGQERELFLLEKHGTTADTHKQRCLYRGKITNGETLYINKAPIVVEQVEDGGIAVISSPEDITALADTSGSVPLPPYIKRQATIDDTDRYQTVFARNKGSVAAPTASLNFTDELRDTLLQKGVHIAYLTLHVGLGTFLPIRGDTVEDHQMHSEYYEIPAETVALLRKAVVNDTKVCAVGTTVTRTLEYAAKDILTGEIKSLSGEANIFIYPSYRFKIVHMLLTNFHAPRSTVLMMAAAFAGWGNLQAAYQEALAKDYKFLSYGDSMLIQ